MSLSKPDRDKNFLERLTEGYVGLLRTKPLATKAITSSLVAMLGNVISQSTSGQNMNWQSVRAYGLTGLIFVGPLMHHFYIWLDQVIPKTQKYSSILRVFLDRFIFAPPFLLVYFYLLSIFEGQGNAGAVKKIKETFWPILKTNWKVWTTFQYVNINYVPPQFRVLFASCLALFWNIYVASTRK